MTDARHLAEQTLKDHENLLLRMADYLSDNRVMYKKAILHCLLQFTSFRAEYFTAGERPDFYRRRLKDRVAWLDGEKEPPRMNLLLSLNKKRRNDKDTR
jgi:hypothetical protein